MSHPTAPPPDAPTEIPAHTPGVWRVGSLAYTGGGLVVLFLLLLAGDFAWSMKERSVMPLFQILLKKYETSDLLTGLLIGSIPALIGLAVGPVVSVWSDRLRCSWGRRIPFLALPTPIIVGSMVALAFSPSLGPWLNALTGGDPNNDRAWIISLFAVFWTLFEVFTIVANAVFNGLVNDVVPRVMIGRFFGLFRMVSLGAGVLFNYFLIGYAKEHYLPVFLAVAAGYGVGFTVMCTYVKEGTYPDPPPLPRKRSVGEEIATYFRECTAQPFFLWVFALLALTTITFIPVNIFSIPAAESFHLSMDEYGVYVAIAYVCSITLAFPLGWMTDRFHPLVTGGITLALYAVLMLGSYFGIDSPRTFGFALLAHTVLSGAFFTTTAGLGLMLFPRMKFSQFMSAAGLVTSLIQALVSPALGRILDATRHDYRNTYLLGSLLAFASLIVWLVVYRRFQAMGGITGYTAPEVGAPRG